MDQILILAKELLKDNPQITPAEMFHKLHLSGYGVDRTVFAVYSVLKPELDELCEAAVMEYKQPLVTKEALREALTSCGFASADIENVISQKYPQDTARYAVVLSEKTRCPATSYNNAYNIGCGDFTVEAWVKPSGGGGTILSRKPTEGGSYNGGFLLVLKPDGTIKLATDDGMGFYEVNSEPANVYDGRYHHILGSRQGETLKIYVDFEEIRATVRTNRFPDLNINNALGITVGAVEQMQEIYNYFNGSIGECRLWKKAVTYSSKNEWADTDYIASDLTGMWGFWNKSGTDYSETANNLNVTGFQFERWEL